MASEPSRETLTLALGKRKIAEEEEEEEEEDEEEEEREIRELEREVGDLGRRILDYRRTIPDRLLEALSASLVAQRPLLPPQSGSGSFPSDLSLAPDIGGNRTTEDRTPSGLSNGALLAEGDLATLENLQAFRAKAASNIAVMPIILQRMNECITRIDKLEKCDVNIHSVFKIKSWEFGDVIQFG
ncbi:uncharacterized protein LOC109707763 isoform X1 [Ananas comosus]|uniref:Uncharacterized protein LOC109707763 isoform X1 n=1 Tax=Ananas comosus TaxID=4615 RepID=A0A6P5EUQ0_ANACO|nr:uncharacterized protein LOC109707763 isoform X1 [Ananas comosus]